MVGEFIKRWNQWSGDDVGQTKNTVVLTRFSHYAPTPLLYFPGYDVNTKLQLSLWRSEFCNYSSSFHSFFFALAACNNARHWADSSDSHHWAKDGATWSADWASLGKHSLWQTPTVMYKNGCMDTWLNLTLHTPVKSAKIKPTATKMSVQIQKTAIIWSAKMPLWGYSDKWKNEVMSKEKQQRFNSEWENIGGGRLVCVCVSNLRCLKGKRGISSPRVQLLSSGPQP